MALNRYSKLTPLEHTGSFFELPAEMLENAVMAKQKQYDAQQEAYDTYLTALSSMEMLPEDIAISEQRKNELMTKEKALRDQFGGDLASAGYAQQFSDILRADATDPFYRRATFHLAQTKLWQKAISDYTTQHGVAPSAWQDPFGANLANYKGAMESTLPVFSGIQQNIAFQPYVIDNHLKVYLEREVSKQTIESQTMSDGNTVYYHKNGERMTVNEIHNILKGMNLQNTDAYRVLKAQWDSNEATKTQFPNFDDFFEYNLREIAKQTAYETSSETLVNAGSYGGSGGGNYTRRTEDGDDVAAGLIGSIQMSSATNPLAFTSRDKMAMTRGLLQSQKTAITSQATTDIINLLRLDQMPSEMEPKITIMKNGETDNMSSIMFEYKENGTTKKFDLSDPMVVMSNQLPLQIKEQLVNQYGQILSIRNKLQSIDYSLDQINKLDQTALDRGFGAGTYDRVTSSSTGWIDLWKQEYPNEANNYLDKSGLDLEASYLNRLSTGGVQSIKADILGRIQREEREISERNTRTPTSSAARDAITPVEQERLTTRTSRTWDALQTIAVKSLGIPYDQLPRVDTPSTAAVDQLLNIIGENYIAGNQQSYSKKLNNYAAYRAFEKTDGSKFKSYKETFENHWSKGINMQGEPLSITGGGSPGGIRQTQKTIYSLNLDASTNGARFKTEMKGLVDIIINNGSTNIFDVTTNAKATEDDLVRLSARDRSGNPNYALEGFTFDDEGINLLVKVNADPESNTPGKTFEIRNNGHGIIRSLQVLGFSDYRIMTAADELMKGFLTGEVATGQTEGQTRSNPTSMIKTGLLEIPVTRAIVQQKIGNNIVEEGQFIYRSPLGGEPEIFTNPLDVSKRAFQDAQKYESLMDPSQYSGIDNTTFNRIQVQDDIVERSKNTASQAIKTFLNYANDAATQSNINLLITSLNRNTGTGIHMYGDAVDIRIKDGDRIDENIIKTIDNAYSQLLAASPNVDLSSLYTVIVEMDTANGAKTEELRRRFPNSKLKFITNPQATAPHIHIQFNRQQLVQR